MAPLKTFLKSYWKSAFVVVVILHLSFAPPSTFKAMPHPVWADKLVHLFMYFALASVLIFDFSRTAVTMKSSILFFTLCIAFPILMGGAIEIIQPLYFSPRTASFSDFLSNAIGVFLGWLTTKYALPVGSENS